MYGTSNFNIIQFIRYHVVNLSQTFILYWCVVGSACSVSRCYKNIYLITQFKWNWKCKEFFRSQQQEMFVKNQSSFKGQWLEQHQTSFVLERVSDCDMMTEAKLFVTNANVCNISNSGVCALIVLIMHTTKYVSSLILFNRTLLTTQLTPFFITCAQEELL